MDALREQPSTDRLSYCHLALEPLSAPSNNSPSHPCPRPSMRDAPAMPTWRELAAQRVQSGQCIPVRPHPI
jgi:hypothetical protein